MKNSKDLAMLILGDKKDKGSNDESSSDKDEKSSDLETLASDILDSIEDTDSEALASSLKKFVQACHDKRNER